MRPAERFYELLAGTFFFVFSARGALFAIFSALVEPDFAWLVMFAESFHKPLEVCDHESFSLGEIFRVVSQCDEFVVWP